MERIEHDELVQGSPAWEDFRFNHDGASEIAAVMGLSKKMTREELLRIKVSGTPKEFSDYVRENVLDKGHEVEALARPFAVAFAGVDGFYPKVFSYGRTSASTDGLDMLDETGWECKLLNKENGPIVKAGKVPDEYMPQVQQSLMVTGADRWLFTVTDGTRENTHHVWVEPDTDWYDRIRKAWKLFNEDRANYQHVDHAQPLVRKEAPAGLPALLLDVKGDLVVTSNLNQFEVVVQSRIDAVKSELLTDQDFEDARADVKFLKEDVEEALEAALIAFLKKNEPVQVVIDTVRRLQEKARAKRLPLFNSIDSQTKTVRIKILTKYEFDFATWLKAQNDSLSTKQALLPDLKPDFAAAMKSKRLISAIHDACKQVMANAKLAIGDAYTRIQTNMTMMREKAGKHGSLFQGLTDVKTIVNMEPQAAEAVVVNRIRAHEDAEKQKREEEAAAARAKTDRDMAMQEIQGILQQVIIAEVGRAGVRVGGTIECMRETLEETQKWVIDERFGALQGSAQAAKDKAVAVIELLIRNAEARALEEVKPPAAQEAANESQAPDAPTEPGFAFQRPPAARIEAAAAALSQETQAQPTLNMGRINAILSNGGSGITVTADFLKSIGCPPAKTERGASLYHDRQILDILEHLGMHFSNVYGREKAKQKREAVAA